MIKCTHCQGTNREGDIYCRNCGEKIISNAKLIVVNIFKVILIATIILMIIMILISLFM